MQAREAAAHLIQPFLAEHFLDARENLVFLEPHVVVEELSDPGDLLRLNLVLGRKALLKIQNGSANLGVIAKEPDDVRILVNPRLPRIRGEKHFLFLAKMHLPRFVPESNKLLRLSRNSSSALFNGRFRGTPHFQRLN